MSLAVVQKPTRDRDRGEELISKGVDFLKNKVEERNTSLID